MRCFDHRTAQLKALVRVAAPKTTACAFGGPDLDTLYITSAAEGSTEAHAGDLFAVKIPGVKGLPATPFKDTHELLGM